MEDLTKLNNRQSELQVRINTLEKRDVDKNLFISVLAHDLRSPFNTILGFLEILKQKAKTLSKDEIEEHINQVHKVSQNTYNLLEELLEWVGTESGVSEINKKNHKLTTLFNDVIENLAPLAAAKSIIIHQSKLQEVSINCDSNKIKAVLRNLISNAIKFTKVGGVIGLSSLERNNVIEVSVSDNGVGINAETKLNLFKISSPISSPGTMKEKGSGLGLIICKKIIEEHHGTLTIDSKVGIGSIFTFTIPTIAAKTHKG